MKSLWTIVIIGVVIATSGCATAVNQESEKASLLRTDQDWATVAAEGKDIERIVSFWTDDATILPANAPSIKGKTAIRKFVEESLKIPGFNISWRPTEVVTGRNGDLGYTMGENVITVPGADGKLLTLHGRYVTIWRKEATGEWKCVVDIWNSGVAP